MDMWHSLNVPNTLQHMQNECLALCCQYLTVSSVVLNAQINKQWNYDYKS